MHISTLDKLTYAELYRLYLTLGGSPATVPTRKANLYELVEAEGEARVFVASQIHALQDFLARGVDS